MRKANYFIGDVSEEDLEISKVYDDEEFFEPDGEFTFATLKQCREHCLERIDYRIRQLQRARKRVMEAK